ncbi:FAD-dependent oxidoreductase [Maribacter sp. 2307ULW6-5]|uniref:FAD-dependent oxidoreductase n=1 Tax=Maribacter sp. 2307ULW6-5 TaxID=3386275 RepID=UPI0039BD2AC1
MRLQTKILVFWLLVMPGIVKSQQDKTNEHKADVIVYGGTSAAVIAAVQVTKMKKSVILVSPDRHLGGLSSSGLGFTDTGDKSVIGGLSREFYQRVYQYYQNEETWKWQTKEDYGNVGQGTPAIDGENKTMWIFEPSIAERIFEDFVQDYNLQVHRNEFLDRKNGVEKNDGHITSITTLSGKKFKGEVFIDATYEGDLMAASGVSYHVGREANRVYNEQWNGVQIGVLHHHHHFGDMKISPYRIPGDSTSGVLPRISTEYPGKKGEGDTKVQAYCFRMCLTKVKENRVPFEKPEGYDPDQYELLARIYESGWDRTFKKFDPIPNLKTDSNNHGPFSTDNIGMNYDYPEASYERRREIVKEHENYQKGLFYFLATDPRIPKKTQLEFNKWGLAKDEFVDNGNWPYQLYIREARRMIGEYVMTEHDILNRKPIDASIGMGSYSMDSHNVQRYITPEGYVQNEGDIGVHLDKVPYKIHLGSILPKQEECSNLLVPVAVSSSHIAFGSIRMEPVFMVLSQSAATIAVLAIQSNQPVQEVPYHQIKKLLIEDGQVLDKK